MGVSERRKPLMIPLPDTESPHRSHHDTAHWCRGQVGVSHRFHRLNAWTFFCQNCGKQRYQGKELSLATQAKQMREDAGYTQEALAERCHISVERVKDLERHGGWFRRDIRLATLDLIASVCRYDVIIRLEPQDP